MKISFIGNSLRLARLFQGMTLQDLGNIVSVSRQYIQQIENGAKTPNQELIAALAEALSVRVDYFETSYDFIVTDEECHFRSQKTTPVNIRAQAVAHGTFFDKLAQYLDEELDLPEINFPKFNNISEPTDIERATEKCRIKWGLGINTPITNMIRVLENAGALVTYFADISEKIDAFSLHRKRPLIIRNPAKESTCRMRFDLAHECGHIVMHEGITTGDNKTEGEANRFASAFLLPRPAFLSEFGFLSKSASIPWKILYDLKLRWKVSIAAIMRRAYDLKIIDAIKYRNSIIHLRKTGQSKSEKYDEKIPEEEPEVIRNAFQILLTDQSFGLHAVMDHFKVGANFFKRLVGDISFKPKDFIQRSNQENVVWVSFSKNLR